MYLIKIDIPEVPPSQKVIPMYETCMMIGNSSRLCYIIVMFSKQKYIILGTKQRDRFMFEEK